VTRKVHVAGVGMIPFTKPGKSENYNVMGEPATFTAIPLPDRPPSMVSGSPESRSSTSTTTAPQARRPFSSHAKPSRVAPSNAHWLSASSR
jgi:hypothetical protein